MALYIDGSLDIEYLSAADGTLRDSAGDTEIGRSNATNARVWAGELDDVRIYNRALSAAEIQRLYGCTAPAHPEGAILYNPSWRSMQYCNGVDWVGIGKQPQEDCPNIGDTCIDGTVYAGDMDYGAGNEKIYTTRCDAGQTWSGSYTGTRANNSWNNGCTGWVDTSLTNCASAGVCDLRWPNEYRYVDCRGF